MDNAQIAAAREAARRMHRFFISLANAVGEVAVGEGIVFSDDLVVIHWLTEWMWRSAPTAHFKGVALMAMHYGKLYRDLSIEFIDAEDAP